MGESRESKGDAKESKKKFTDTALGAGLKPVSINKLAEEDFDSLDAIQAMTDEDVESVGLTRGQTRLLQKWIASLQQPVLDGSTPLTTTTLPQAPTTTQGLSKDQELQRLLDLLTNKSPSTDTTAMLDQPDHRPSGKALFISDFVTKPYTSRTDNPDTELCNQGDTQLIIRSTRQKPAPEQVNLAQWISANAMIMSQLIKDGSLGSQDAILDYLQYTKDFGDYAQVCDHGSVMLYDHEYRRKQALNSTRWGIDDIHLATFYLQRKLAHKKQPVDHPPRRSDRPPRLLDASGVEICRNFNANLQCSRDPCRFSHACAICKERGHTKSRHDLK